MTETLLPPQGHVPIETAAEAPPARPVELAERLLAGAPMQRLPIPGDGTAHLQAAMLRTAIPRSQGSSLYGRGVLQTLSSEELQYSPSSAITVHAPFAYYTQGHAWINNSAGTWTTVHLSGFDGDLSVDQRRYSFLCLPGQSEQALLIVSLRHLGEDGRPMGGGVSYTLGRNMDVPLETRYGDMSFENAFINPDTPAVVSMAQIMDSVRGGVAYA